MEGYSNKISSKMVLRSYKIGNTLGYGSFAKVKLADHILTGHKVAIKILNRNKLKDMEVSIKVQREIKILRLLMHPHIIRQYEVIETKENIYVVMEYVKSGELFDYIAQKGRLQEDEGRYLFQQIISGVEYCHQNKIVHRDLKQENILLDSKCNIKIADFGLSNVMHDGHFLKTSCGSPNYAAPEVVSQKLYVGPEVDIWSCGVILYALLCGTLPFDEENVHNLFAKIKRGIYTLPDHLSYAARDLIPRMLMVDPILRISISEIRQHPWFNNHIPCYLAFPPLIDTNEQAKEINFEIVQKVVNLGYDRDQVIESLVNRIQNEETVSYYLLLDNRPHVPNEYFESKYKEILDNSLNPTLHEAASHVEYIPTLFDNNMSSLDKVVKKWNLGIQSRAKPCEIMSSVFKALQNLKVCWKKIGDYNIKCRFVHQSNISKEKSHIIKNESDMISPIVVKFELQLYKVCEGKYLLDIQRVYGPHFLFLNLSVAFLIELRVL